MFRAYTYPVYAVLTKNTGASDPLELQITDGWELFDVAAAGNQTPVLSQNTKCSY